MQTRFLRKLTAQLTALVMTAALLFAQVATAAHACPTAAQDIPAAQMMSAVPECSDMAAMAAPIDAEQPQLCKRHCAPDQQATASSVAVDASPNLLAIFPAPALLVGLRDSAALRASESAPPPGAPPPRILFQVFRS